MSVSGSEQGAVSWQKDAPVLLAPRAHQRPSSPPAIITDSPLKTLVPVTPRTAGPMPRETELLELCEDYAQGGIWGIGLSVEKVPPHAILHVEDLIDIQGQACSHLVSVGDCLLKVDDREVQDVSIESLETVIFGPLDTTVKLSLMAQGKRAYDVHVKRHVPINVWDRTLRWYCLKREFEGQDFLAENKIIQVLEGMRAFAHDGTGSLADLIKDNQAERSTLGILLTLPNLTNPRYRPGQIRDLTPGGPAYLSGQIQIGDEIVAVDGVACHDSNAVTALVRGSDDIGTKCLLTISRHGQRFEVELARGSSTRVRTVEKLFKLVQSAESSAKQGNTEGALQALSLLIGNLSTSEKARMNRESRLSERLSQMQTALFKDITAAEKALHPLPDGASDEIMMQEKISIQPSARVQRSAAPPPPQPVFDDQELITLRKQVSMFSTKCNELEMSTRSLSEANQMLLGERDSMEAEIRRLKDEMARKDAQHKAELEDLRAQLAKALMERDEAQRKAQDLLAQHERDVAEMEDLRAQLAKALFDRDVAQRKTQELAREIETLLASIEEFEKLVQHLRDDNTTLKHQVVELQKVNDALSLKIETEMVLRTEYMRVQEQSRDNKAKADAFEAELDPLKSQISDLEHDLKMARAEAIKWKDIAQQAQDELAEIKKLLMPAGLSDKPDILTLGQLLAGPPKTFIQDVFELLRLLKDGPPARTIAEATKIIEIMNMEEPWSADYLLRVRNFLRGPPALTLQDLQGMLDHRGDASTLQSQQTKLAELMSQVNQLRAENDALQNENSALKAEVSTLKRRITELEREIADLQAQLAAANKRISDLEAQLAALKKELAELMAALDASRQKECRCKPVLKEVEKEEETVINFSKSKQTVRAQRSAALPPLAPELAAPAPEPEPSPAPATVPSPAPILVAAPVATHQPREKCGIGLLLEKSSTSKAVRVKTVVSGGPADRCGRIRVGDEVLAVNGSYIAGLPLHNVFTLVLGEEGTLVTLDVCQHIEVPQPNGDFVREITVTKITLTRAYPIAPDQQQTLYSSSGGSRSNQASSRDNASTPTQYDLFGLPLEASHNKYGSWKPDGAQTAREPYRYSKTPSYGGYTERAYSPAAVRHETRSITPGNYTREQRSGQDAFTNGLTQGMQYVWS